MCCGEVVVEYLKGPGFLKHSVVYHEKFGCYFSYSVRCAHVGGLPNFGEAGVPFGMGRV